MVYRYIHRERYNTDTGLIERYDPVTQTWTNEPAGGGAVNLDDLHDVSAGAPNDGDVLTYHVGSHEWWADPNSGGGDVLADGSVPFTEAVPLTEVVEPADAAVGTQRLYIDATTHKLTRKDENSVVTEIEGGGSGGPDPFGWNPAAYRGTYDAGTTYAYGDAVRASDGPDWKLYISAVSGNVGHNPIGDDGSFWVDTVAADKPVIVQGNEGPAVGGEQNRITHYTQDGTGGTFNLGSVNGIAFDAVQADIQAALDALYGTGKNILVGDAADFTVELYGNALEFDDTDLTGGGLTLQVDIQDQIVGGFLTGPGSFYIQVNADDGRLWVYNADDEVWHCGMANGILTSGAHLDLSSNNYLILNGPGAGAASIVNSAVRSAAGQGLADSSHYAERSGDGNGSARANQEATVDGTGDGDAYTHVRASRQGEGGGDAEATILAEVNDTAIGTAYATSTATHHTGGSAKVGPEAAADGARTFLGHPSAAGLKIADLPNVDPALATPEIIYNALVSAGLALDGS